MLMYSWMKFVEVAPGRYDWAVRLMTGGRVDDIKDRIAATVTKGDRVLDIGCGTGTLGIRCCERGARFTGIDISPEMLEQARRSFERRGFAGRAVLIKDSVTQLHKRFLPESFDVITSTMVLGEFPSEYLNYVFHHCLRLLRPGGRLLIGDETWPDSRWGRLGYQVVMGLMWIPQFVLLRRVTYPVDQLENSIREAGFEIGRVDRWPGSSFRLVHATKPAAETNVQPSSSWNREVVVP
jgi:demethylmenaquinone methyltransferase/2-methoxy-6-polyprenyl-1,4-benzoquinol methylase